MENKKDRLLRWHDVNNATGLARTTIWRMEKAGNFPKRLAIGPKCVAWKESQIQAWIAEQGGAE